MDIRNIKAYVYWDFDDVLGRTHAQMLYLLKYIFGYDAPTDIYLTPGNTDGRLAHILDNPTFMRTTGFDYTAITALKTLREQFPRLTHGLATHRGYHKDGESLTMALLDEHQFTFDSYHFMDPAVIGKDKMAYLRSLHEPGDIIILVDDNTFYDHTAYENSYTVLVDKPWNQEVVTYSPELRTDPAGILQAVKFALHLAAVDTEVFDDERAA